MKDGLWSKPLVTVVIPSYNSPDLYGSLDSVLGQTYERIQLILIDDGSAAFPKLAVEEYLRSHCGSNIEESVVLVNENNVGTVRSLNRAFRLAKGQFIFNLAGDDCFYDTQVLTDWVAAFLTTGAQVMTARREAYDEKLEQSRGLEPTKQQICLIKTLSPAELFEQIAPVNFIFGCCTARSADSIRQHGYFDERYRLIEDHSMNLRLLRNGVKIEFFDRTVIRYRGGGSSWAGRYHADYERDVDLIFQYEVLPFTRFPKQALRRHRQWKRDQSLGYRYQMIRQRYEGQALCLLLLWVWYRAHHPWRTICRLPEKMFAILGGSRYEN